MNAKNYRFYSFVANLYLSPIQCGIQTAHAVSEMAVKYIHLDRPFDEDRLNMFNDWAATDKTVIVCAAINHAGVTDAYAKLQEFGNALNLPTVIFHEDEQSMNGMATAAAIIVPMEYYEVKFYERRELHGAGPCYIYTDPQSLDTTTYEEGSVWFDFIQFLKSFRLA